MKAGQGRPLVSICDVSQSYGAGTLRRQVLFDVTAEVWPGEIVIVTGPSGSGKTTMLMLIGALRHVQQGSLRVFGTELQGGSGPGPRFDTEADRIHLSVAQPARRVDGLSERADVARAAGSDLACCAFGSFGSARHRRSG
jgi:predicted ABC-type transport system involved in lysophospholipase L1 biosynthesis ATPase subunit